MKRERLIFTAVTALLVVVAGGVGLFIGARGAPDDSDAEQSRENAAKTAQKTAYERAFKEGQAKGFASGLNRGKALAKARGRARGKVDGEVAAQEKIAEIQAEQARLAAEREAAERAKNCGAPLFIDGYCPTDEEIRLEEMAETYCGGGRYEEGAALGIEC